MAVTIAHPTCTASPVYYSLFTRRVSPIPSRALQAGIPLAEVASAYGHLLTFVLWRASSVGEGTGGCRRSNLNFKMHSEVHSHQYRLLWGDTSATRQCGPSTSDRLPSRLNVEADVRRWHIVRHQGECSTPGSSPISSPMRRTADRAFEYFLTVFTSIPELVAAIVSVSPRPKSLKDS